MTDTTPTTTQQCPLTERHDDAVRQGYNPDAAQTTDDTIVITWTSILATD